MPLKNSRSTKNQSFLRRMAKFSTVVVGGGVTGLALAHRLLVAGGGKIGVTLLEAQPHAGGVHVEACIIYGCLFLCAICV